MAMLPFAPAPFFADKNRAFWRLQMLGWGGAMMVRASSSLANQRPLDFFIIILIATITGFSLSTILSVIYGRLIHLRPLVMWGATVLVLAGAVAISAFINGWVLSLYQAGSESSFASLVLGVFYLDLTLLGAWTGLYYAINYFLQVEEQADRLERLESQATSAQLAMLRYQLNPHFLFNTLNSISTLVLMRETEPANAMLTRLSSFLRHTLVTVPGGKVTVAQEVDTLKLYLEIERMRFEERLRTEFCIDPDAADACIPSLLLQPLVENAIKYAVSAQEEGARIRLSAQVAGEYLRLTVSDTGPGLRRLKDGTLPDLAMIAEQAATRSATSTGVGLANIRERLGQAYGEKHVFAIDTPPGGGFTVIIELPLEREAGGAGEVSGARKPAPPPLVEEQARNRELGITA